MSGDPFDAFDQDGCDADLAADPLADEEVDLYVLFADALDPSTQSSVAEREREWGELLR